MLRLEGIAKRYEGRAVLAGLDLEIAPGRTTVLIGPSGSGKSTLLRVMIGLIAPDAGQVLFDGTRVEPQSVMAIRLRVGYVLQDGGLFPHLTAADNICLMARQLGWEESRIAARLEELTAVTHLPADTLARYPAQISGGQRQRVGLMRGLMLDPELLLLDEPLGALDPMVRSDLQSDLRAIFRALGKTVVLVTHDLAEAAYLGDTIVLLREGRVVQQGPLEQLVRAPVDPFVTQFISAQRVAHWLDRDSAGGTGPA